MCTEEGDSCARVSVGSRSPWGNVGHVQPEEDGLQVCGVRGVQVCDVRTAQSTDGFL